MNTSDERAQRAEDAADQLRVLTDRAKAMKDQGNSILEIAETLDISINYARNLVPPDIEWGFNCLTGGVHHGRPEKIWNLTLLQIATMFSPVQLQQLVVDRIYNDAMQFVNYSPFIQKETEATFRFTQEWANKTKEIAAPKVLPTYQNKVGEIAKYYHSPEFKRDIDAVVVRNKQDKLNPHYEPLHPHDTLNMLCRTVGVNSESRATEALSEL